MGTLTTGVFAMSLLICEPISIWLGHEVRDTPPYFGTAEQEKYEVVNGATDSSGL